MMSTSAARPAPVLGSPPGTAVPKREPSPSARHTDACRRDREAVERQGQRYQEKEQVVESARAASSHRLAAVAPQVPKAEHNCNGRDTDHAVKAQDAANEHRFDGSVLLAACARYVAGLRRAASATTRERATEEAVHVGHPHTLARRGRQALGGEERAPAMASLDRSTKVLRSLRARIQGSRALPRLLADRIGAKWSVRSARRPMDRVDPVMVA